MVKSPKNQTLPLDQSLYQEISEVAASQYQGGAISNELTQVVQQKSVVPSQTKIIIFAA
ncbi:hypothetical protein [[Phormidium ambiguum] IAM M-71]|uniref:hypothetical protein n=1 Tax=[Phormidium ambiguum] IAM M-71 TaxID=454136 RepID=UPI0015B960AF|nr:hypothetical protein [Phormidium ambiguum]